MPNWMFEKIKAYLKQSEGVSIEASSPNKALFTDVFGFRYEITIRNLGRNQLWKTEEQQLLTKENLSQIKDLAAELKRQI